MAVREPITLRHMRFRDRPGRHCFWIRSNSPKVATTGAKAKRQAPGQAGAAEEQKHDPQHTKATPPSGKRVISVRPPCLRSSSVGVRGEARPSAGRVQAAACSAGPEASIMLARLVGKTFMLSTNLSGRISPNLDLEAKVAACRSRAAPVVKALGWSAVWAAICRSGPEIPPGAVAHCRLLDGLPRALPRLSRKRFLSSSPDDLRRWRGCGPGRGITFGRTYSAASWGKRSGPVPALAHPGQVLVRRVGACDERRDLSVRIHHRSICGSLRGSMDIIHFYTSTLAPACAWRFYTSTLAALVLNVVLATRRHGHGHVSTCSVAL